MSAQDRAALIARLKWHGEHMCNGDMYREAADMLEADAQPAVPQEPVLGYETAKAIQEGARNAAEDAYFAARPAHDTELDRLIFRHGFDRGYVFGKPQPQRPRLTDEEIKAIEHETDMKSSIGEWAAYFARAIEAKVRGEA